MKPETPRSEIHSVQHTCLGQRWGGTGRQESGLRWRWRGEGPEPYLMGPGLSHSSMELPWQADHGPVGRGSAGPEDPASPPA